MKIKKPNIKLNKKTIAIIAIVFALIALIVAAIFIFVLNGGNEQSIHDKIESRANSYKTDFRDSVHQMTDQASVANYLVNWAENKGIDVSTDQNGNVIYSFEANEGLEDRKPTLILCGYDYSSIENYTNSIVSALTLARDDAPHGEYTIIFVSEENGNKDSGHNIPSSYLEEAAEVFFLGNDTASKIVNTSAGIREYEFTKEILKTSPSYNKAYKVSITGLPSQALTNKTASTVSPIETLGNLLATFKSKSVLFDLVEFTGSNDSALMPNEASIMIVVSEDATEKVETRLDNSIESFMDKHGKKYPELAYTYEVVDMPYEVIDSDVTESLISLLYTVPTGMYDSDDEKDPTAFSYITSIDVTSDTAKVTLLASGYDETTLTELNDSYQTICALTDIDFAQTGSYPIYKMNDNGSALAESFTNSYFEYKTNTLDTESMLQYTMCSTLLEDYPDLNLVAIGVTNKTKDNFAGGLIVHLGKLQ